jgi:hypothetical protein
LEGVFPEVELESQAATKNNHRIRKKLSFIGVYNKEENEE